LNNISGIIFVEDGGSNGKTRRRTRFEGQDLVAGFHLPRSPASSEAWQGYQINRTVARELATVERSKILRGEAGTGGKKRKDISFERAAEEFLKWAEANKRPKTVASYNDCVKQLRNSFGGEKN
jgi:hypothetical protein